MNTTAATTLITTDPSTPTAPIIGPGRPKQYKLASGKRIPSVTTITGRFKDAGGLLKWAHAEGIAGRSLDEVRDTAAQVGHIVHQWIQDDLAGKPREHFAFASDDDLRQAEAAFGAYIDWARTVKLTIHCTELPLVSERMAFGGTFDALATVDGELALLDWKSGNRTYPEHLTQVAAYRELLREHDPSGNTVPTCAVMIRLDKETGSPHARTYPTEALDIGWQYFERALELYRLDQQIRKVCA